MGSRQAGTVRLWLLGMAMFMVGSVVLTGCSGGSFVTTPKPAVVSATGGDSQATIAWTAVSGATSYNIYWSTTTGVTPSNGTKISGVTTPYTLTGLTNGTTYYFVVTAVSTASSGTGESSPSAQVSCIADPTPTGVSATSGDLKATIAWTAVSGATSYNIYWSTTTGVTKDNGTKITGATNPYTLTGLTNGTAYYFVVTAVSSDGESAASTEASCTPLQPVPTGVSAAAGNGRVTVAWPAVSGADSYNIYWSATTGVTKDNGTRITGVTTPYDVAGLTDGTTYYYVVTAVNAYGESAPSAEVSCTPMQPVPQGVIATPAGAKQVTISWSPVTLSALSPATDSISSYNIYWSTYPGVTPLNGIKVTGATSPSTVTLTESGLHYFVVTDVIYNSDSKTFRESTASAEVSATAP